MRYLELFSGIGGFRRAADLISKDTTLKFECKGYSEIDRHALSTYQANYHQNGEISMQDILIPRPLFLIHKILVCLKEEVGCSLFAVRRN
jgi:site-specific DNA-cytosine methylase